MFLLVAVTQQRSLRSRINVIFVHLFFLYDMTLKFAPKYLFSQCIRLTPKDDDRHASVIFFQKAYHPVCVDTVALFLLLLSIFSVCLSNKISSHQNYSHTVRETKFMCGFEVSKPFLALQLNLCRRRTCHFRKWNFQRREFSNVTSAFYGLLMIEKTSRAKNMDQTNHNVF